MGQIQSTVNQMLGQITSLAQLKTQRDILKISKMTDAEKRASNFAEKANITLENEGLTTEETDFIARADVEAAEGALKDNPTMENVIRRREAQEFQQTTGELRNEELAKAEKARVAAENAKIAKQEELRRQQEQWRTGAISPDIIMRGGGEDR